MTTNPARHWSSALLLLLLPAAASLGAQAVDTRTTAIQEQVRALADAADNEARRAVIVARLEQIGLTPELVWFDPPPARATRRGANVVAGVSGSAPHVLLLGAHYDRVEQGRGVIDNAAGVASVIQLAEAFARNPLTNYTVRVALFDLEENGLLGSGAMVADSLRVPLPHTFLNFDVFGYGDAFWIGSADTTDALPVAIGNAAAGRSWQSTVSTAYPPSDHLSFRRTSTRSYAVSIIGSTEVQPVLALLRGTAGAPTAPPRIMTIIHTGEDTLDKLDATAVARALEIVEQAIRRFDAGASHSHP